MAEASKLRIHKQYKNSAYSQQSGPISNIVWTDFKFHQYYGFKFKSLKQNLVTMVQVERLYETIYNVIGTTSILKTDAD